MKILKVNGLSNRFKQKNRENVVKMKPAGEANALEWWLKKVCKA